MSTRQTMLLPARTHRATASGTHAPFGVFLVVMRRTFVGMRTGPFTLSCFSLAPRIRSAQTAGAVSSGDGSEGFVERSVLMYLLWHNNCLGSQEAEQAHNYPLSAPLGSPFSKLATLRDVRVMRMRWRVGASTSSTPTLPAGFWAVAILWHT